MRLGTPRTRTSQDDFEQAVVEAKARILAGEAFQIVLSRGLEHDYTGDPLAYTPPCAPPTPRHTCSTLTMDRGRCSLQPETLVSLRKESSPRSLSQYQATGSGAREQRQYSEEMLRDEKSGAEHCMLVDLARNDLARSASWRVCMSQFMQAESFSHVQHIVSKVQGTLAKGKDAVTRWRPCSPPAPSPAPQAQARR